eukprot:gene1423-1152_t
MTPPPTGPADTGPPVGPPPEETPPPETSPPFGIELLEWPDECCVDLLDEYNGDGASTVDAAVTVNGCLCKSEWQASDNTCILHPACCGTFRDCGGALNARGRPGDDPGRSGINPGQPGLGSTWAGVDLGWGRPGLGSTWAGVDLGW